MDAVLETAEPPANAGRAGGWERNRRWSSGRGRLNGPLTYCGLSCRLAVLR
jgi:hypothetical protein